jgi:hypothetical protein
VGRRCGRDRRARRVRGYALQAGSRAVTAIRETITLPKRRRRRPSRRRPELDIEGLSAVVTPNAQFYRIDTALAVAGGRPVDVEPAHSTAWSTTR